MYFAGVAKSNMAGHLNALGLPAHLDEQAELEEELGDITSRLKKVYYN